ncbi:MAG: radical SAM protein [Planctomycetes bacterium]|nr:radical SAM protein [Planctomycetota bacterium]
MPDPTKNLAILQQAYQDHGRKWREFLYCYPVISRRSKGLSIGVNLNPDKACNFDCVYCQVDRSTPPVVRKVDLPTVGVELAALLDAARSGDLFNEAPFSALPPTQRVIRDIAFSGDGEPTSYPQFDEAVALAAKCKADRQLTDTKIVLITDASYLTRDPVRRGLALMDSNNGEIWAKLDAGTQPYYEAVNRPNVSLDHVLANILDAARVRPLVIQSLWMNLRNVPPPDAEILAYCERLNTILHEGGKLKLIQIYTIARRTTEAYATALSDDQLAHIADLVRSHVRVAVESFPGIQPTG